MDTVLAVRAWPSGGLWQVSGSQNKPLSLPEPGFRLDVSLTARTPEPSGLDLTSFIPPPSEVILLAHGQGA